MISTRSIQLIRALENAVVECTTGGKATIVYPKARRALERRIARLEKGYSTLSARDRALVNILMRKKKHP